MASRIPSVTALPCPCPFYGETNSCVWHIQPFNCSHHSWGRPSSGGPDDSHSVGRLMSGRTKTITQTAVNIQGQDLWEKIREDKVWGLMRLSFKARYAAFGIKTVREQTDLRNRAERPERDPRRSLAKTKSNAKEQKRSFPQGALEPLDGLTQKQINLDTGLTPFTNINSKWKS